MQPSTAPGQNRPTEFAVIEAQTVLKRKPHIPSVIRQFFGPVNIQSIVELVTSHDVVEVDSLISSSQLSGEEFVQYSNALPELIAAREKAQTIAHQYVENLRPKFSEIARATIRNDKINHLFFVHNQMAKLTDAF